MSAPSHRRADTGHQTQFGIEFRSVTDVVAESMHVRAHRLWTHPPANALFVGDLVGIRCRAERQKGRQNANTIDRRRRTG